MSDPRPRTEPEEAGEPLAEQAQDRTFLDVFYGAEPREAADSERSA
jgi:hypothetical protein